MVEPRDDRSPLALALEWLSRTTTVVSEMILPPLAGYWLDHRFGTGFLLLLLGTALGFATGLYSLVKMIRPPDSGKREE